MKYITECPIELSLNPIPEISKSARQPSPSDLRHTHHLLSRVDYPNVTRCGLAEYSPRTEIVKLGPNKAMEWHERNNLSTSFHWKNVTCQECLQLRKMKGFREKYLR